MFNFITSTKLAAWYFCCYTDDCLEQTLQEPLGTNSSHGGSKIFSLSGSSLSSTFSRPNIIGSNGVSINNIRYSQNI